MDREVHPATVAALVDFSLVEFPRVDDFRTGAVDNKEAEVIDPDELDNDFRYHPPVTDERREAHEAVRAACTQLGFQLNALVPDGPEKVQAIKVNLAQVMFWANAGIARKPDKGSNA